MTTFLLRAVCPRCNADLIATTSAPRLCEEPEAQAECVSCGASYCVKVVVERCGIGPLGPIDVEKAIDRAAMSAAYGGLT